jgi:zinc transport system substrate-binding protein
VYTSFYPTTYFAQRIGGDHVKVVCPLPADADPAFWMPDAEAIAAYQRADLIVFNGATFEKWPVKVSLPRARILETAKPLAGELIEIEDAVTHSHGPGGAHTHGDIDGHTWIDPVNAKLQAQQIADAFARTWPVHADAFKSNMAALAADLDKLDAHFKQVSEKLGNRTLLCAHPAYNYAARRYGWQVVNFHLDLDIAPDEEQLAKIAKARADHGARIMIWESEPLEETKTLLRERIQLESIVFAPAESLDESDRAAGANYLTIMHANADRLLAALDMPESVDAN